MNYRKYIACLVLIATGPAFTRNKIHRIVIIGGGPAAYSAAISAGNAKLNPLVIEGNEPGGQPIKAGDIKNFPSYKSINGGELVSSMKEHAEHLGAQALAAQVVKVNLKQTPFKIWTDKGDIITAHTVIIATGSEPIKLNCPGEEKCWGKGVIVCAKCDGHLFTDKEVVIVGGGYSALRELGNITKHTSKVTLVNPDKSLSGPQFLINIAKSSNAKILHNYSIESITEKNGKVIGVVIKNKTTGAKQALPADGVLVGLGWRPSSKIFKGQLKLNSENQIAVTGDANTSVPGVYAAGDVGSKSRHQLFMAASSGFAAAMDAEKYLQKQNLI